jgi:hypothetical protein
MTYDVFFVNQETVVTQDTKLYSQEYVVNNNAYDYVFLVNTGNTNSINELFSTRTYVQNYSDPNRYDIDLTTNQQFTNMLFGVSITGDGNGTITMGSAICATGSFDNQTRRLPHRMLEVMAHKIFGHAQARAAIANDAAFETLIGALSNGLNNSINQMRNDIFNQYITYDRIERIANGLNNVVTYNDDEVQTFFNFDNAEFDCPVRLVGRLNGGGAEMGLLNNGPDVLGNRVINGEYSIPMLVRFRRANAGIPVPNIAYQQNNYTLLRNVAMTNLAPTNTGGPALSWSVSPALPTGVSFNTATGVISGTPSGLAATTVYTVTALGVNGPGSFDITITVNERPPAIAYGASSYSFFRGVAITDVAPTNSAGPINSFALTGTLPAGMSFNAATGVISGTPSVTMASASYSVTATGLGGTSTASFTIVVNERAPIVSYSASSYTFATGTAITALTPTNTGGLISSYSVSPALPAGLSLNTSTGIITGTPSNIAVTASYNVIASGAGGSSTVTISITVNSGRNFVNITPDVKPDGVTPINVGPGNQFYKYNFNSGSNTSVDVFTKTASFVAEETLIGLYTQGGNTNLLSNSANIINIDSANISLMNGIINFLVGNYTNNTTTPNFVITNLIPNTVYSIIVRTTYNDGGADKHMAIEKNGVSIPLTYVDHSAPNDAFSIVMPTITYQTNYNYGAGNYIYFQPTTIGATFTSFSISPSLPTGLTFSQTNGVVNGSSNTVASTIFTVTGVHSAGTATSTFTLNITPTFNYPDSTLLFPINTSTTILPNVNGATFTSFSVSPSVLPAGFSFNTSTGAITGSPTAITAATSLTVTATYAAGTINNFISIRPSNAFTSFVTINSLNATARTINYTINNQIPYSQFRFGNYTISAVDGATSVGTYTTVPFNINELALTRLDKFDKFVRVFSQVNGEFIPVSNMFTFTDNIALPPNVIDITSVDLTNKVIKFIPQQNLGTVTLNMTYFDSPWSATHGSQSFNLVSGTEYTYTITVNPTVFTATNLETFMLGNGNGRPLGYVTSITQVTSTPVLAYRSTNFFKDEPGSIKAIVYGTNVTSYAISPSLPAGLTLNTSTGEISGTPTVTSSMFYNITGTTASGNLTFGMGINVDNRPQPTVLFNDMNLTVGNPWGVGPNKQGASFTSFTLSPSLPAGLRFNSADGAINGNPTSTFATTSFTLTGFYNGGSASTTFNITVS